MSDKEKQDDPPVGVLDERSLEDSLERQLAEDEAETESEAEAETETGTESETETETETETGTESDHDHDHDHRHEHEHQHRHQDGPRYGQVHDGDHHVSLRGSDRTRPAPTVPVFPEDDDVGGASRETMRPTSLGGMVAAGMRALRSFPGLVASMYLAQIALSAGAAALMGLLLYRAFGLRPVFDRAMTGDVGAFMTCFGRDGELRVSLVAIGLGAVLAYCVLSWFMTAGLIAVVLDPPQRRREVARWFGAGGAANFFPFLRLALWTAIPYAAIAFLFLQGTAYLVAASESIVSRGELALEVLRALGVPLLAHWIVGAAVDLARVDLVRHPGLSGLRALLRGFGLVVRRPAVLLFTLGYAVLFALATLGYVALAAGPAAAAGLAVLVLLRQLCAAIRFGAHVGLLAGQVELSCSSLHSPRRRFVA